MSVRAKFTLNSATSYLQQRAIDPTQKWEASNIEIVELRVLKFAPVNGNGGPNHENAKFWQSTPNGSIELGCVNPEAWSQFELGKDYYIDFKKAD